MGRDNFSLGECLGRELSRVGVQIPMHDYKSLRVAVVICATLVNTQTDSFPMVIWHKLSQPS